MPLIGEMAIMISRMPGGDMGRTSMATAMLFAQPARIPAEFLTEQHALQRRPGQLEASTAMARAMFDANGQREVLLDQRPTLTMPTLVIWGGCDYVLPTFQAQAAVDRLPHGRLALFPDCGHLPHVECDRFADVMSSWLLEHHDANCEGSRLTTESVYFGRGFRSRHTHQCQCHQRRDVDGTP